jgi:hypothetical protein
MGLERSDILRAMAHHLKGLRHTEKVAWMACLTAGTHFVVEACTGGPLTGPGSVAFMTLMVAVFLRGDLNSADRERADLTRKLNESLSEPNAEE